MFGERNIKLFYLKTFLKIKSLLNTQKFRRILIFLFFFLISLGFWLLQTLKNDFDVEVVIPVKLINVPNDVVITGQPVDHIRVGVKDKGTVLLNYFMGREFYPIQIDFKEFYSRGTHVVIRSAELEKKIQMQLSGSTRLTAIKPEVVDFIYSLGGVKKVPVVFRGRISSGRQYYVTDTIFNPDSVYVYAPQSMLDSINMAYTQTVMLDGVTDVKNQRVPLLNIRGAKFVPNVVNLKLLVDILTEKTVVVPLVGTNFPTDRSLRTFPAKVKVTFQTSLHRQNHIKLDDFSFDIRYEDLLECKTEKYPLRLKTVPVGVAHVRVNPQQVDFLIEKVSKDGN